jgi:hypothetical protein
MGTSLQLEHDDEWGERREREMQKDGKAAAAVSAGTRRLMKNLETYAYTDPTKVRST